MEWVPSVSVIYICNCLFQYLYWNLCENFSEDFFVFLQGKLTSNCNAYFHCGLDLSGYNADRFGDL